METKKLQLLPLRLIIASIYLVHGLPKALNWDMAMDKFASMGFPGFLGPIVGIAEVLLATALVIGVTYRWANIALAGIIGVAIAGVQLPKAFAAGKVITGLERDALILSGHVALAYYGAGKLTLTHLLRRDAAAVPKLDVTQRQG